MAVKTIMDEKMLTQEEITVLFFRGKNERQLSEKTGMQSVYGPTERLDLHYGLARRLQNN